MANGTSTTYAYDPVSRLTSLALAGGTNANTATLSNYSPAGEIGARANSNDAFAWTAGVNVNRPYTVNGLNQFATVAGAALGYDARGNLTSSSGTTYAYASEKLLKTLSGGYTLAYDPIGRLAEYDTPTATRFVYDGGMISEEVNSSGAVLRRYAFRPAGDEMIVWYEGLERRDQASPRTARVVQEIHLAQAYTDTTGDSSERDALEAEMILNAGRDTKRLAGPAGYCARDGAVDRASAQEATGSGIGTSDPGKDRSHGAHQHLTDDAASLDWIRIQRISKFQRFHDAVKSLQIVFHFGVFRALTNVCSKQDVGSIRRVTR